ncbi:hypothetical protein [Gluconobacter cerinus]|uniref:Uncharacterized protein n=1 Tax=Gluconobacter cerinus TaxID=38307 RepID=A0A1B6VL98_9PROT|nr:hypothetical protein [Gluconobacter cerinus]OAJ67737.1 hypothetical protein A0123_01779 [Gluconobacter cerinus]
MSEMKPDGLTRISEEQFIADMRVYRDGAAAYHAGVSEANNPYQHPSNDFFQWQRGFLEARADDLNAIRSAAK